MMAMLTIVWSPNRRQAEARVINPSSFEVSMADA
jgi:hypothetical protein